MKALTVEWDRQNDTFKERVYAIHDYQYRPPLRQPIDDIDPLPKPNAGTCLFMPPLAMGTITPEGGYQPGDNYSFARKGADNAQYACQ